MYKYKLKENSKFEVGDVEIKGGKKSTISHINPTTGAITWDLEDVGAFDTVYKTFDKLNQLIKTLESEGEAESDTTIDSIASKVKDLFNDYRTHIRRNYPEAYERVKLVKEGDEEGEKDVQTIEKLLKRINNKKEWGELINKLVSHEVPTLTGMGKKKHLLAITKQLKEDLSIKGKKVKTIHKNDSNNPEDHTIEYEDGSTEPYLDHLKEEEINEGFFQKFVDNTVLGGILGMMWYTTIGTILDDTKAKLMADKIDSDPNLAKKLKTAIGIGGKNLKEFLGTVYYMTFGNRNLEESVDEGEGIGYLTPKAFDKNKKSTGASDIYYYKLGFKPVPKKIKGAGTIVKQLWETEELTEYSDFQQKRIRAFDEVEVKLNSLSPLLSNSKNETAKYYNENPGSYAIVYSTDMVNELLDDITELLKQEE